MAYINDLNPLNTSGNTKTFYTSISQIVEALTRMNPKCLRLTYEENTEVIAQDQTTYMIDPGGNVIILNLPLPEDNPNFSIFVKQVGAGQIVLTCNGGKMDGVVADVTLGTNEDYIEMIADQVDSYWTKIYYID